MLTHETVSATVYPIERTLYKFLRFEMLVVLGFDFTGKKKLPLLYITLRLF